MHLNKRVIGRIFQVGLPAGFQGVIFSLSNVVIQSSINSFGDTVMAGSAAAQNIEGFVYAAMNAFYQSARPSAGRTMVPANATAWTRWPSTARAL